MTDLEITRRCAEAMGLPCININAGEIVIGVTPNRFVYHPLHDDAQVMALVKKFRLDIRSTGEFGEPYWSALDQNGDGIGSQDLNRAICTVVAKM